MAMNRLTGSLPIGISALSQLTYVLCALGTSLASCVWLWASGVVGSNKSLARRALQLAWTYVA